MYNLNIDQKNKLKNEVYNSKITEVEVFPCEQVSCSTLIISSLYNPE